MVLNERQKKALYVALGMYNLDKFKKDVAILIAEQNVHGIKGLEDESLYSEIFKLYCEISGELEK